MDGSKSFQTDPHLLWKNSSGKISSRIGDTISKIEDAISELKDQIKQKEDRLDILKSSLEAIREMNKFVDNSEIAGEVFSSLFQLVYDQARVDGRNEVYDERELKPWLGGQSRDVKQQELIEQSRRAQETRPLSSLQEKWGADAWREQK